MCEGAGLSDGLLYGLVVDTCSLVHTLLVVIPLTLLTQHLTTKDRGDRRRRPPHYTQDDTLGGKGGRGKGRSTVHQAHQEGE
eukprot:203699-Prorocentrum_lima.AAC.1